MRRTSGDDDILMVSRSGQAARFHESQVRSMGRATGGIKGMNVSQKGNRVLAMDVARDDQELLVVTENGYGKRTALSDYPRKGRGTMGVKTIAADREQGRARRRARRARARGAASSSAPAAWSSARPCAGSTATAAPPRACG